jgi:hypothetical protein
MAAIVLTLMGTLLNEVFDILLNVAFNQGELLFKRDKPMTETQTQNHPDAELIEELGGPTALAERLGYEKPNGPARVSNWKERGIPAQVKVDHPEIFLLRKQA